MGALISCGSRLLISGFSMGMARPNSIGGFVSHGCIRMYNQDIADLYDRVRVGTPVTVMR
jgi:hypothetical protein